MPQKDLNSQSCTDLIEQKAIKIAQFSGKSVTQMGLYEDCLNETGLKYGLLLLVNKTTSSSLGMNMGLCIPQICQVPEIEQIVDGVFQLMQFPIKAKFTQNPEQFFPEFSFTFYLATTILLLCSLLVFVSTISSKISKKYTIIGAFSLRNNIHVFEYKQHKFNVFNGVKAICMLWVILGHTYSLRMQITVNMMTVASRTQVPFFLVILAAFYAVDVFFYLGGFLVAYSFLRNQMKSMIKYPLAILHRLLRFWPSYIMAIFIYSSIMIHLGKGPFWSQIFVLGQINFCTALWKPIFFMDNLVDNGETMCMGWGWYLQNDMQIFILSIPILFLYNKNKQLAYIVISTFISISIIINFIEVQINQYITIANIDDFAKWDQYLANVYIKPWIRNPPYLYGLILGLLYMEWIEEQKQKKGTKGFFGKIKEKMVKNSKIKNGIQIIGLSIILFIVFIPRTLQGGQHKWAQIFHSLYLSSTKLFFVIGVSMVITPCLLGIKNDLIFWLLDTKLFNFISKISFWTYLIHFMVIQYFLFNQKVDFYYNVGDVFVIYIGIVVVSMFFGFAGTLLIEIPFSKLQKMIFENKKQNMKNQNQSKPLNNAKNILNQSIQTSSNLKNLENLETEEFKQKLLRKSDTE